MGYTDVGPRVHTPVPRLRSRPVRGRGRGYGPGEETDPEGQGLDRGLLT